jgi:hypothetical protein
MPKGRPSSSTETSVGRLEATARAKWDAIEKTVGVDVKAGSLISNLSVVEDVIRTRVGGSVRRFRQKERWSATVACL